MAYNGKLICDFWYGNTMRECDNVDCFWSDCDCVYRGNFYIGGKMVGDYTAVALQAIKTAWENTHG